MHINIHVDAKREKNQMNYYTFHSTFHDFRQRKCDNKYGNILSNEQRYLK